jgi:zinc-binding alcohol dehydrogenase family protein
MKAIAITEALPTDDPKCFVEIELPTPRPGSRDLLVQLKAVALNPVDTKVRLRYKDDNKQPKILGWDAAGVVVAIGPEVKGFNRGDEVYYAGDLTRDGCNAQMQLVDERIVAPKPRTLNFEHAAAFPLTALTAWEGLFERLGLASDQSAANSAQTLLIIGAAGGVGSIAIQLAKQLTPHTIIATASRADSESRCRAMGADHVIQHSEPLLPQLESLGLRGVDAVFCLHNIDPHWNDMVEMINPLGRICAIVDSSQPLDLNLLKRKSASFAWEFMFTRAMYQTPDMAQQGKILRQLAALIDAGTIQTTHGRSLGQLNIHNLARGHALIETGRTLGKLTLNVE